MEIPMIAFGFSSLRYRLLLLVLLAVLPALVLVVSTAWEQRRLAAASAQDDALRFARLAATTHERLIESARSLLVGLAQLADVQMHYAKGCRRHFAEILKQFPLYRNVGAVRPDGNVFCVARPPGPRGPAEGSVVSRARAARGFIVSGYVANGGTEPPTLTLSYPAIDGAGEVWAVVFTELDLTWMYELAAKAQLPAGSTVTVTDAAGLVLARHPGPSRPARTPLPDAALAAAIQRYPGGGTTQALEADGVTRLLAFVPLPGPTGPDRVYVSVGVPRDVAFAHADRLLVRNLFWAAFAIVLVVAAAVIVSDLFILRRVDAVVAAAERLSAGDLDARAEVRSVDEIGVLARTFNLMAEHLAERVNDAQGARAGLAARVSELDILNQMGEFLQACLTLDEAYGVIGRLAARFFPGDAGAVFAFAASRNVIEVMATWGAHPTADQAVFGPDQCWALRNGQPYVVADTAAGVLCQHLPDPVPAAYLCVPLVAQGEALGVLYVGSPPGAAAGAPAAADKQRRAEAVAAQLALALANVRLRERLRDQSIRDPLTGLFNRRYTQETLEREVHRTRRRQHPMAVLTLSVDGFKQLTDTFGHEAGDTVLRELAVLLQSHLRREDIACRFDGEEFVVVLPEASLAGAETVAEQLRILVTRSSIQYKEQALPSVTASIGVAAFPDHGLDGGALLEAANAALHRAKREGRDRVAVARAAATLPAPS
jgi:diguanylate cyclase (GGDEF)-like protein